MYKGIYWTPRNAAWLATCLTFAVVAAPPAAANVLLNSGFETDAFLDQAPVPFVSDWSGFGGFNTSSANLDPARTGIGALQLVGNGGFGVPGAFQTMPATPGQTWDFQGYMRAETALTAGTRALLKIVFRDATLAMDLEPAQVIIGTADAQPFPGIISAPQLISSSAAGEWHFAQAQGVAPAGTTEVSFFALLVDETAGVVYFDDFQADLVVATVPGDFDGDGDVDAEDLGDWKTAYGTTDAGDADNDGDSDGADFLIWQQNLTPAPPGASAVPEPATVVAMATGLGLLACASRRRAR